MKLRNSRFYSRLAYRQLILLYVSGLLVTGCYGLRFHEEPVVISPEQSLIVGYLEIAPGRKTEYVLSNIATSELTQINPGFVLSGVAPGDYKLLQLYPKLLMSESPKTIIESVGSTEVITFNVPPDSAVYLGSIAWIVDSAETQLVKLGFDNNKYVSIIHEQHFEWFNEDLTLSYWRAQFGELYDRFGLRVARLCNHNGVKRIDWVPQ